MNERGGADPAPAGGLHPCVCTRCKRPAPALTVMSTTPLRALCKPCHDAWEAWHATAPADAAAAETPGTPAAT